MTICNTTHSVKRSIPQALWCLEGTTLSNRGQRPRIIAHSEVSAWKAVRQRTDYSSSTRILTDITDRTDHVVAIRQKQ